MPSKELLDPSHQRRLQHDAQRTIEPHASTAALSPGKTTLAASYAAAAPMGGVAEQLARSTQSATYSLVALEAANRDGDVAKALHALGTVKRYVAQAPASLAQLPLGAYPQLEEMVHAFLARAERAIADAPQLSRPAIDAARRRDFSLWDAEMAPWIAAHQPAPKNASPPNERRPVPTLYLGQATQSAQPAGPAQHSEPLQAASAPTTDASSSAESSPSVESETAVGLDKRQDQAAQATEAQVAPPTNNEASALRQTKEVTGHTADATPQVPSIGERNESQAQTSPAPNTSERDLTGDSSYGLRFHIERDMALAGGVKITMSMRVEVKLKTRDHVALEAHGTKSTLGAKETWQQIGRENKLAYDPDQLRSLQNQSTPLNAGDNSKTTVERKLKNVLTPCISESLAKTNLNDIYSFSLGGIPVPLRAEIKLLDAKLSPNQDEDKHDISLDIARVSLIGEVNLWKLLDPDLEQDVVDAKASLRLEVKMGPEEMAHLIRLREAQRDMTRVLKHGEQLVDVEIELDRARQQLGRTVSSADARHLRTEIRVLEGRLGKLKLMSDAMSDLYAKAIKTTGHAAAVLKHTPVGRVISKLASKAMSVAFRKLLPIYNVVSTAEDLYDLGKFLHSIDWADVIAKIRKEKEWEHGSDWNKGQARGRGESGPADEPVVELPGSSAERLHPTAQAIVDSMRAQTHEDTQTIPDGDMALIARVVPRDLTAAEIARVRGMLSAKAGNQADALAAVIGAIEHVRPDGGQASPTPPQTPPMLEAPAPSTRSLAETVVERSVPTKSPAPRNAHGASTASRSVARSTKESRRVAVDPVTALRRAIQIDPATGKAAPIRDVDVPGMRLRILAVKTNRILTVDDQSFLVVVTYRAESGPMAGDTHGSERQVVFETGAPASAPRAPQVPHRADNI